jgi:hypothetical protein
MSGIPGDVIAATAYHHILRNTMGGGWGTAFTPATIYNILLLAPDDAHFTGCNWRGWWDGVAWHEGSGGNPCDMYDLWGMRDSANVLHMYTVGNPGFSYYVGIWRYSEGTHSYTEVFRDPPSPFFEAGSAYGVWGSAPDDVYVVGRRGPWSDPLNGAIYHFDGVSWQRLTDMGPIPNVSDVWGSSAYDIWFTLNSGQLLHLEIFNWAGFFEPVANLPVQNQVKAGRAIPVKFSLDGNRGLDILAVGSPASQEIVCDGSAPIDDIEATVTAGKSGLSYDAVSDQYTYSWKTEKAWSGTCRQLVLTLADGTEHKANFMFR